MIEVSSYALEYYASGSTLSYATMSSDGKHVQSKRCCKSSVHQSPKQLHICNRSSLSRLLLVHTPSPYSTICIQINYINFVCVILRCYANTYLPMIHIQQHITLPQRKQEQSRVHMWVTKTCWWIHLWKAVDSVISTSSTLLLEEHL